MASHIQTNNYSTNYSTKYSTKNLKTKKEQTPNFVLEYLEAKEQLNLMIEKIKRLEKEVVDWGVCLIRSGAISSKTLPVTELEEEGKELILREKLGVYNQKHPKIIELQELIDLETEEQFELNKEQINKLMFRKQVLEDQIQALLSTPKKQELEQELSKLTESLKVTAPVKRELQLRKKNKQHQH